VDKPKWEKLEEGAGDVQRVLGEEEEWERLPLLVDGRFQGAAAGPLEGAPEGELKREYARLAGSSSGRVGCAKNLKAVGQAAGGAGQWALVR